MATGNFLKGLLQKEICLIQAGCLQGNIKIVEEAAAILQFCLYDKQHTGVTSLDDICNRRYIVVECEGKYVYL